jgi:hypothetical protein
MKVTTVSTVYVGKGAKAKAMEPGTGFDTKKVGMDDQEALDLIAGGHLVAGLPASDLASEGGATAGTLESGGEAGASPVAEDPAVP